MFWAVVGIFVVFYFVEKFFQQYIVLCYIMLDKILPIAVDRASDSLSHSLDHFTDRLFGR